MDSKSFPYLIAFVAAIFIITDSKAMDIDKEGVVTLTKAEAQQLSKEISEMENTIKESSQQLQQLIDAIQKKQFMECI